MFKAACLLFNIKKKGTKALPQLLAQSPKSEVNHCANALPFHFKVVSNLYSYKDTERFLFVYILLYYCLGAVNYCLEDDTYLVSVDSKNPLLTLKVENSFLMKLSFI